MDCEQRYSEICDYIDKGLYELYNVYTKSSGQFSKHRRKDVFERMTKNVLLMVSPDLAISPQHKYMPPTGKKLRRADFFVMNMNDWLECKFQEVNGSVSEKIPFQLNDHREHESVYFIYEGLPIEKELDDERKPRVFKRDVKYMNLKELAKHYLEKIYRQSIKPQEISFNYIF